MQPGAAVGPYVIARELGAGGMGTVYLAHGAAGTVALKVVHPHLLADGDAAARFRREVEIGRAVEHVNVVRTLAGGESDGVHWLAMEFVEGQTLAGLLRELTRVPEELCRHIAREMCKGLAAIHAAGAVHRDVKPENVLITRDHVVKLMDLGVARSTDDALRLSQTGAFVGSLHYAAPEQFTGGGRDLDGRVDLHALGLVLYELATGICPYLADDLPQTVGRVLHETPRRLGEVEPQLSPFFEEVVHCLLAKDRDARFASADELLGVLEAGEESAWWHARAVAIRLETCRPLRRIRIPRETAVYGRDAELAKLRTLFERAQAGDGNVVLVEGEAGIGKSRLVDEFVGRLRQEGHELNFLFGGYPPGGAASGAGAVTTALREHFDGADLVAELRGRLGAAGPLAAPYAALLVGGMTTDGAGSLTRDALHACTVALLQSLAADGTTVLLLDDLHFAPDEAYALFMSLALAVPGHRLLVIATTRPGLDERRVASLTRLAHVSRVPLGRLGPKDLALLLRDCFRSDELARTLAMQIGLKSDGNPYFAFEIIQGLREGQFVTQREDGSWASTREIGEIRIPSTVLDLVNARVADLSPAERELLDVAACCGFEFDPGLVADAVGAPLLPTLRAFAAIEQKHRLVRASGRRLVFDHHQVQEALYGALYEQLREAYHAALGSALERRSGAAQTAPESLDGALAVELCSHLQSGAEGARALRYLARAQAHLARGHLHARAVALGDCALAQPGLLEGAERARVLLRQATSRYEQGRAPEQGAAAREALTIAERGDDERLLFEALRAHGLATSRAGRNDEAVTFLLRALDVARRLGDRVAEAGTAINLGATYRVQGRFAEAHAELRRGIELCHAIGHAEFEGNGYLNLGGLHHGEGNCAAARDCFARAQQLFRAAGVRRGEAICLLNLCIVAGTDGRREGRIENLESARETFRALGDRMGEAWALATLGNAHFADGRLAASEELRRRVLALSRELGDGVQEGLTLHNLGNNRYELGDVDGAVELYRAGLATLVALQHPLADAARLALARCLERRGARDEAVALLESVRAAAHASGSAVEEALALCQLAACGGATAADALAAFRAAEGRLGPAQRRTALLDVWAATGDVAHLAAAKRVLDDEVRDLPDDVRTSVLENLRQSRELLAAWREHAPSGADA